MTDTSIARDVWNRIDDAADAAGVDLYGDDHDIDRLAQVIDTAASLASAGQTQDIRQMTNGGWGLTVRFEDGSTLRACPVDGLYDIAEAERADALDEEDALDE